MVVSACLFSVMHDSAHTSKRLGLLLSKSVEPSGIFLGPKQYNHLGTVSNRSAQ